MSIHTNETTILNLRETLRRVTAERDELRAGPSAQRVAKMTGHELVSAVSDFTQRQAERILALNKQVAGDSETIEQLQQQIAEKDAKIADVQKLLENTSDVCDRYRNNWIAILREIGAEDQQPALYWIKSHCQQIAEKDAKIRELEADSGRWKNHHDNVACWYAELLKEIGTPYQDRAVDWIKSHRAAEQPAAAPQDDGELVPWTAETRPRGVVMFRVKARIADIEIAIDRWTPQGAAMHHGAFSWFDLFRDWEWSRDGQTWEPCGTRKGVQK